LGILRSSGSLCRSARDTALMIYQQVSSFALRMLESRRDRQIKRIELALAISADGCKSFRAGGVLCQPEESLLLQTRRPVHQQGKGLVVLAERVNDELLPVRGYVVRSKRS